MAISRMGVSFTTGKTGDRLMAPTSEGGYNMFPITSMFGYQHELQYLSAGEFQALFEFLGTIQGLESGKVVPAITVMNGFRFNKSGIEIAFSPSFRGVQLAKGYYDSDNKWHLENEMPEGTNFEILEQLDQRGDFKLSTSLISYCSG